MQFISENVSTYEALFFILTIPLVLVATAIVAAFTFIITAANAHHTDDMEEKPPIAWVKPILLTCLNGAAALTIAVLFIFAAYGVTKGHYEASGTIDAVTFNKTHAGQPDGVHEINLILDNGDPVTIQMPLSDPDIVVPGADFTLKTNVLMNAGTYDAFRPIEDITYSKRHQSLIDQFALNKAITIDFVVDGDIVKGD